MNKVLVVVAHPDDEVLGCGGTITKRALAGDVVNLLVLSDGLGSRTFPNKVSPLDRKKVLESVVNSANILGIVPGWYGNYPDQQFDTIPFLEIVKMIEKVKDYTAPEIIYTHYEHDLNLDHRITFQACLAAFRPVQGEGDIQELYSFEVPSSTEWSSQTFTPNVFVDISDTFTKKIKALKCYEEPRKYPHPRSIEAIEALAKYRGSQAGLKRAEAFKLVRWIK